ncbi:MAG TPA: hypothetical protein VII13_10510 [Vicinamibacteria bacterium]
MRHRLPLRQAALLLATLLAAVPAWAVKEWYVHYEEGKRYLARNQCKEALASLREAQKLRPKSELGARTYGMDFTDYLPHYYQGVCHVKLGEHATAVLQFNLEEQQGAVRKSPALYKELLKLRADAEQAARNEAEDQERVRRARLALAELQRLRREGEEHYRAGRLDAALAQLVQARKAAELLDPAAQAQVDERIKKIRAEAEEKAELAGRAERIEKALAAGERLLEQGQDSEAKVQFDDVLALEPANARAREGRRRAEEGIMAHTTRQQREALMREGRALYRAGEYEKALRPLSEAAADPANTEAQGLLAEVRRTVAGMRQQTELRQRVEQLLAEAEQLIAARKFPEAMVRLGALLEADPSHVRARERLGLAERMTGDDIFEKIFPNQEPVLLFADAPATRVESATVAVVGLATDDRGLSRIEYRAGPRVIAAQPLAPEGGSLEQPRTFRIEQVFALEPGDNEIAVAVTDTSGVTRLESFRVRRDLRFHETRAFIPSALGAAAALVGAGLGAQALRRRRAVRRRFNPYIAGAPVMDDDMFFGRSKLLARIMNVLHHNSLMITGERRIGKTTFLYHLRKALGADTGTEYKFYPVFIDLQGVTEDGFFHAVMSDVVEGVQPTPETSAALRLRAEEGGYDGRDFSHDLQRVIEELKTRTERKVKLALLIDEVDVLNQFSERINQRLRGIFMKTFSEHLVAVMSGVGIRRTWNSEGSPWYNFFDEVELSTFSREEAEALIRQPVEGFFRYETGAVERIVELSGLKPYVIQKFCVQAINQMLEEGKTVVAVAHVEMVRPSVLAEAREDGEPAAVYRPRQASA